MTINEDNVFPADATYVAEALIGFERINGNESLRLKPTEPLRITKRSALSATTNTYVDLRVVSADRFRPLLSTTITALKKVEPLRITKRAALSSTTNMYVDLHFVSADRS